MAAAVEPEDILKGRRVMLPPKRMTPEEQRDFDTKLRNISHILAETAALNAETAALSSRAEEGLRRLEESQRRTDATLRRDIGLAVREARNERERRRIADEHSQALIDQLTAAQLVTEEKLKLFLESRTRHNGGTQTLPPQK